MSVTRAIPALVLALFALSPSSVPQTVVSYRSGDETVSAMLYAPPGKGPFPALIAIHAIGGLDDWVISCRSLSRKSSQRVGR